jgi:uncharacterized membrane protein YoaK (UPF0700 family)
MMPIYPPAERTRFGAVLTMAAGSIDAYSYLFHGQVFAGLQTGNLILLGLNLAQGHLKYSLRALISILAFFVGTLIIRWLQRQPTFSQRPIKRQKIVLLYEMALLLLVACTTQWLPALLTTMLLSITAAAELQEFRRLNGGPFTPLMMTGNLRTLAETAFDAFFYRESAALKKLQATAIIMFMFTLGAAGIVVVTPFLHQFSLLLPVTALAVGWFLLASAD